MSLGLRFFLRKGLSAIALALLFAAPVFAQTVRAGNGTAALPAFTWNTDLNTGLYRFGADTLGIATGGVASLGIRGGASPTIFGGAGNMTILSGTGNSRQLIFQATNNAGAAGDIAYAFYSGTAPQFQVANLGTAATPALGIGATATGFFNATNDTVAVSNGGVRSLSIAGGAATSLIGGAGNLTVQCGTGNSRTCTFQTTTSAGTAKNTLVLGADSSATFLGQIIIPAGKPIITLTGVGVRLGSGGSGTAPGLILGNNDTNTGLANENSADTLSTVTAGATSLRVTGGANGKLVGGAGNMTILAGTGASRTLTLQTTTSGSVAKNTLVLGADSSTTFLGKVVPGDTLRTAFPIRATALTAASGTPNTVCMNATTKEITENAALDCTVSSARFKRNIVPLTDVVATRITTQLKPVAFTYKDGGRRAIGLIAEQADSVDTRLSTRNDKGQINSVNYNQVTIVLLKQVQTLTAKLDRMCKAGVREAC